MRISASGSGEFIAEECRRTGALFTYLYEKVQINL